MGLYLECYFIYDLPFKQGLDIFEQIEERSQAIGELEVNVVYNNLAYSPQKVASIKEVVWKDVTNVWFKLILAKANCKLPILIALSLDHGNINVSVDDNVIFERHSGIELTKSRLNAFYEILRMVARLREPACYTIGPEYYIAEDLVYPSAASKAGVHPFSFEAFASINELLNDYLIDGGYSTRIEPKLP